MQNQYECMMDESNGINTGTFERRRSESKILSIYKLSARNIKRMRGIIAGWTEKSP